MRNECCPICKKKSPAILQIQFNKKMRLPTEVTIRQCTSDNFLFVANGDQDRYDEYYTAIANDSYHGEIAKDNLHSPIAACQCEHLLKLLDDFFAQPRTVLDFGCGEAWLLVQLASKFPGSTFLGFDPSPGAQIGARKATALGLSNLTISDQKPNRGSYDLIIASHVLEHLIDFNILDFWNSRLAEGGVLYVEVPDALQYPTYERLEFQYYFDRLHVNHFSPQALARLLSSHGFGYCRHAEYKFPYRDGKDYPAFGMLFKKNSNQMELSSPSVADAAAAYVYQERQRASRWNETLKTFDGLLIWGAGDNFHRSTQNSGPLSSLSNMIVLDQREQVVMIGSRKWSTQKPVEAIRRYLWPIVITVSEGRKTIAAQVTEIDSSRQLFFL